MSDHLPGEARQCPSCRRWIGLVGDGQLAAHDCLPPVVPDTRTDPCSVVDGDEGRLAAAVRALYELYDVWHNRIGTCDPGDDQPGIASLITVEDSRLLEEASEAIERHLDTIRAVLKVDAPAGSGGSVDEPASMQVVQKAWVVDAGRLLMVRYGATGDWDLPGGRVEVGDVDLDAALAREVAEETGLTAQVGRTLVAYLAMHTATRRQALFVVREADAAGEPTAAGQVPEDDIAAVEWVPLAEVAGRQINPCARSAVLALVGRGGSVDGDALDVKAAREAALKARTRWVKALSATIAGGGATSVDGDAPQAHRYLSTACLHAQASGPGAHGERLHAYCRTATNPVGGTKKPGECKFCDAMCVCVCHESSSGTGTPAPGRCPGCGRDLDAAFSHAAGCPHDDDAEPPAGPHEQGDDHGE